MELRSPSVWNTESSFIFVYIRNCLWSFCPLICSCGEEEKKKNKEFVTRLALTSFSMVTTGVTILVPVNNCSRNGHAYLASLALCCISKASQILVLEEIKVLL